MTTKPTATIELITPEWAIKVLDKSEDEIAKGLYHQRPFSERVAMGYAVAMQAGHWLLNDQGIMFDTNGWLRDGRHRLWAIVMSGASVEMWVMRNCSDKEVNGLTIHVVDTVDVGKNRGVGQQLAIDGTPNANRTASAVRCIARLSCNFPTRLKISVIQTRQILEFYKFHLDKIMDGFHNSHRFMSGFLLGPLAMFRNLHPPEADAFISDLFTMERLTPGSPVIALSKFLAGRMLHSGNSSDIAAQAVSLAAYHYHNGSKVTTLRHCDVGSQWLMNSNKGNTAKIRAICGITFQDHRN